MVSSVNLPHGTLQLPEFLPDATRGVVRAVDSQDLIASGVQGLVMNTFHLMQNPGTTTIQALGGIHRMSDWNKPIITDSGGFQIYSLIHQNSKFGSLNNKGASFRTDNEGKKYNLTPEKSIQLQISYGSDVVICLDDCTHVDAPIKSQEESVRRTILWARRAKSEYVHLIEQKHIEEELKPLIFAVIQGGGSLELRRQSTEALLEIGFDGYGYGGWPLDSEGNLLIDLLGYVRQLVPPRYVMHALGVAHPKNIVECASLGYDIFDGAMPTRDARHARLYSFNLDPLLPGITLKGDWFDFVYVLDDRYRKSNQPVSPYCDCLLCTHYSTGYVHHLFKIDDALAPRLATIHNLRFMSQLTNSLRMTMRKSG